MCSLAVVFNNKNLMSFLGGGILGGLSDLSSPTQDRTQATTGKAQNPNR